ncbi:MAG: ATP-binding protein, partial [Egibacteraceae bacterium]
VPPDAADDPLARLQAATGATDDALPLPGYTVGEPHWGRHTRPAPPREARMLLVGAPVSVGVARRFVAGVLHSWRMSELADGDVILCTSELVTNAVRYATSAFTVIVRYDGNHVRVEVGDGSRALPQRRVSHVNETRGRGMGIIDTLASAWGTTTTLDGKRVWFAFAA